MCVFAGRIRSTGNNSGCTNHRVEDSFLLASIFRQPHQDCMIERGILKGEFSSFFLVHSILL